MRIAVIGGKLQGLEAVYLAGKAGWETVVIDRHKDAPAAKLADRHLCLDVKQSSKLRHFLKGVDMIIPALEEYDALEKIVALAEELSIPLAFDMDAYEISSSKRRSDALFADLEIPFPRPWPDCDFPLIAKPAGSSGSEGVVYIGDENAFELYQASTSAEEERPVIQEYLDGPSYSLEVIGYAEKYLPLQVTGLEMDAGFDCKRVFAPAGLEREREKEFARLAVKIAAAVKLKGIMDVEVILHNDQLKVLEIDARLPSQTPITVFHSSGINMLELLASAFVKKSLDLQIVVKPSRAVIFEHIALKPGRLEVAGEHIMADAGPLTLVEDFFGADEALTDYSPGQNCWVATLIILASTIEKAREKREAIIHDIKTVMHVNSCLDPAPEYCGKELSGGD